MQMQGDADELAEFCEIAASWPHIAPDVRHAIATLVRAHLGEVRGGAATAREASGASAALTLFNNRNKIPEAGESK